MYFGTNPLANPAVRDNLLVPRYAMAAVDLLESREQARKVYGVGIPTIR